MWLIVADSKTGAFKKAFKSLLKRNTRFGVTLGVTLGVTFYVQKTIITPPISTQKKVKNTLKIIITPPISTIFERVENECNPMKSVI